MILMIVPRRPRPESRKSGTDSARIDMVRGILFGPAIAGLLITLEYGRDWGWTDQRTVLLLVGAILMLAYWSRHQWRAPNPLIQLRLMMHGKLLRANLVMLFNGAGCSQIGQILIITLQQPDLGPGTGFAMSGTASGLLMIPLTSVALVVSPLSGRIAVNHGARRSALIGASLALLGWMLLAVSHGEFWLLVLGATITLIGISFINPAAFTLIVEAAPREVTSGASGLGFTLYQLGYAVGAQIMLMCQRADTISAPDGVAYPSALGLSLAYGYAAVMTVPLIVTVLSISKQHREQEEPAYGASQ